MTTILTTTEGIALWNALTVIAREFGMKVEGLNPANPEEWKYEGLALGLLGGHWSELKLEVVPNLLQCEDSNLAHELEKLVCVVADKAPERWVYAAAPGEKENAAKRQRALELGTLRRHIEGNIFEGLPGKMISQCRRIQSDDWYVRQQVVASVLEAHGLRRLRYEVATRKSSFPELERALVKAVETNKQTRKQEWLARKSS